MPDDDDDLTRRQDVVTTAMMEIQALTAPLIQAAKGMRDDLLALGFADDDASKAASAFLIAWMNKFWT